MFIFYFNLPAGTFKLTENQLPSFAAITGKGEIEIYIKGKPTRWNESLGMTLNSSNIADKFERNVIIVTNSIADNHFNEVLKPFDYNQLKFKSIIQDDYFENN